VLRADGTLWLNLGDSYATGAGLPQPGLKPKDLCGIPWRVAFALQADGWWLRQDIIWSKPNPMPESVTDRCTKAHEYLFLLSKNERYFYDAESIKEAQSEGTFARFGNGKAPRQINSKSKAAVAGEVLANSEYKARTPDAILPDGKRNKRSVWTVASEAFPGADFATFPPALIEPCILAGCPRGGTVLDPFGGAGTTGLVADRLGRNAILIELNPDYIALAERRLVDDAGMFASAEKPKPAMQESFLP
jgi:DNA modification methylase